MKFSLKEKVIVERSDSRGERAECYGVITKIFKKEPGIAPRGYLVSISGEEHWYPERFVRKTDNARTY